MGSVGLGGSCPVEDGGVDYAVQADVLIVVPVVWPLVLITGAGAGGGAEGAASRGLLAGRSTTCLASACRGGAAAGTLFDATALTAMIFSEFLPESSFYRVLSEKFP